MLYKYNQLLRSHHWVRFHYQQVAYSPDAYLHSANGADNTPQRPFSFFFDELRLVLHAYCRDAYPKHINGNQGAVKGYLRIADGNRPEDLSLFSSVACIEEQC